MNKETKELKKYQDPKTGLWGLKDEAGNIIKKPFAYYIYYDGRFQKEEDGKLGIVDMKTGDILAEPFAGWIFQFDGRFEDAITYKYGFLDRKTGAIVQKPFADWINDDGSFGIGKKRGILDMKTGEIIGKPETEIETLISLIKELVMIPLHLIKKIWREISPFKFKN